MAIGYSKILSRYQPSFIDSWIFFIRNNFAVDTDNLNVFDNEGNKTLMPLKKVIEEFVTQNFIAIEIKNTYNNALYVSINIIDNYLAVETYDFDQLLTDEEYIEIYSKLNSRFQELISSQIGIGFIYDEEGYSEDYIRP